MIKLYIIRQKSSTVGIILYAWRKKFIIWKKLRKQFHKHLKYFYSVNIEFPLLIHNQQNKYIRILTFNQYVYYETYVSIKNRKVNCYGVLFY